MNITIFNATAEDLAAAVLDEIEQPRSDQHFTVAQIPRDA